jgi:hypothetical protein
VKSRETAIRRALREYLTVARPTRERILEEFWIPISHERVDVVHVNGLLRAYEIKSERDSLMRLPRQVAAFSRVFDEATAVIDRKHVDEVIQLVPAWWGLIEANPDNAHSRLQPLRTARWNPDTDAELQLRLLWKSELLAIVQTWECAATKMGRENMRKLILSRLSATEIGPFVRRALLTRDHASRRWSGRGTTESQSNRMMESATKRR